METTGKLREENPKVQDNTLSKEAMELKVRRKLCGI
jgi:hypothetical protein